VTSTFGPRYGLKDPDRIACAQLLIEAGAKLDLPGPFGYTPLMNATVSHYPAVEVTKMLVDARANLLAVDQYGNTAVHSAAIGTGDKNGQLKQLMMHPDYTAALAVQNPEGKTPLLYATEQYEIQQKKVELAPYFCERVSLLEAGKSIDGKYVGRPEDAAFFEKQAQTKPSA